MLLRISASTKASGCSKSGVSLIEILIVTVIIGLIAAISFPVFKIIQQREKERRLKKILYDVRSAILGSKSPQSATEFTEGYRTYIRVRGVTAIQELHTVASEANPIIAKFVANLAKNGRGYPDNPTRLIDTNFSVKIATSTTDPMDPAYPTDYVEINVDRRFLRHIPPHPFKNWFANARFEFRPATNPSITRASDSTDWGVIATGVMDIVSRGAGLALDGSKTDDW